MNHKILIITAATNIKYIQTDRYRRREASQKQQQKSTKKKREENSKGRK